ncbi:hypothetical protein SCLCIDRAFT_274985 [Scleroderma citrinum Foug A]|uniref:Uncharacterized protein n=1 Tax=Scleroderma citrinum Foug A TaxID=1036808 RepID=A0A0C3DIK4_9AGAM|nr:hypothetical protein SCLCIDRAFT_274985 [Scleroderma citrinum Foug A]
MQPLPSPRTLTGALQSFLAHLAKISAFLGETSRVFSEALQAALPYIAILSALLSMALVCRECTRLPCLQHYFWRSLMARWMCP